MAGNHILPMHPAESSLASNELTASSISGPSGGYVTTNSQQSVDETTVSGVTLPKELEEKPKPSPPPPPPPPQRNDSFSRRSHTRRTSGSRQVPAATASMEGPPSRELSRSGSLQRSGSFSRRSGRSLTRRGSHRSQRSKQRESQRSQSRSNRSRRRIDDDMASSSSSSWETDLGDEDMQVSKRSLGANSSASTIFESVGSSDESSEMEEASTVSYEEESSSSADEDDEMDDDDDENDTQSSASYPIISFPDESSVVSGLTDGDMDFDVTRLTLLRDELNDLKKRAITEGDQLSKEELIRCLERLQNIQEDVLQEAETRSLASEVEDSFRHSSRQSTKDSNSKSSFSEWETDPELEIAAAEGEGDVTPKSMRSTRKIDVPELMAVIDSPKIVEENRTPRKGKKPEISEVATPKAGNKARKAEFSGEAPPAKKKKKRKSKEKKLKKRKPKNSEVAADDDDDDATPKVKTKKKGAGKTKKKVKGKEKEKKRGSGKAKKRKSADKDIDAHIEMDKKHVEQQFDEGEISDTDKTPRRRTTKGTGNSSEGKSKSPSYIARNSERLFRHPLFQSNLGVPTSPEQTEVVDGQLNASPSAIPKRSAEQRESSRRSRRSVPVAPDTDPNAGKRRTLKSFMTGRNVTPSPGAKSPGRSPGRSPGILSKKPFSNPSLGIFPTPPSTPPAVRAKSMINIPQTDPTAGKKKKLSRFLNVRGRGDFNKAESTRALRSGSPSRKSSKEKEGADNLNSTDHAVAALDTEGSQRKHRTGGKKKYSNGITDSPSSMLSKKKSLLGPSTILESTQETEEVGMDATDHAVIESSQRRERRLFNGLGLAGSPASLLSKKNSLREKLESQKEESEDLNETNHAVVETQKSTVKRRGSLGRLFNGFGSVHTNSSSAKISNPPSDVEDYSSPSTAPRKIPTVPQTDPSAFKRRSVGRLFNGRGRSKSPSSVVSKKPASSSTLGEISKQSIASGVISDSDTSTGKRRSFGRLFGSRRARSRSPSTVISSSKLGDVEDISSPTEVQRNSIGAGVPETDPNAAARRSLGRLSISGGVPSSPQTINSRRSMRTTRTTMRNSGHANHRKSASVRTERTLSIDEPSPTGLHFRNRMSRNAGSGASSMRSRRTVGEDFETSPGALRRGFPTYSSMRGRSSSPSNVIRSSNYHPPDQSPGPRPVRGRRAARPSVAPKTAPVGQKARVSTAPKQGSQRGGRSFPMVPDLLDSGDELEDDELRHSRRSHSLSRHSARFVDNSGHVRTVDTTEGDDQLDLEYASNHSTGEKGGRKARRGGRRKQTLSPSPRQRVRKKKGADDDPIRTSVGRAKERREQLLSKGRDGSSEPANGLYRIPRRKKSDTKSKRSIYQDEKEAGTEPTEHDEAQVGEVKSGMKSKNGSSRGMRSINNLMNRIRHKSTDTIDC